MPYEGSLWNKTTAGILFSSFYFGSQVNLFNYLHEAVNDLGILIIIIN